MIGIAQQLPRCSSGCKPRAARAVARTASPVSARGPGPGSVLSTLRQVLQHHCGAGNGRRQLPPPPPCRPAAGSSCSAALPAPLARQLSGSSLIL